MGRKGRQMAELKRQVRETRCVQISPVEQIAPFSHFFVEMRKIIAVPCASAATQTRNGRDPPLGGSPSCRMCRPTHGGGKTSAFRSYMRPTDSSWTSLSPLCVLLVSGNSAFTSNTKRGDETGERARDGLAEGGSRVVRFG